MAENYLRDARAILIEAKAAQRRRLSHRAVRLSQESFELSLKGILRSIGIEYPKEHEVSDALKENSARFPEWLQSHAAYLEEGSVWLWEKRGTLDVRGRDSRKTSLAALHTCRLEESSGIRE